MNADGSGKRNLTRNPARDGTSFLVAGRAEDRFRQRPRRASRSSRHERRRERSAESDAPGEMREVAARASCRSSTARTNRGSCIHAEWAREESNLRAQIRRWVIDRRREQSRLAGRRRGTSAVGVRLRLGRRRRPPRRPRGQRLRPPRPEPSAAHPCRGTAPRTRRRAPFCGARRIRPRRAAPGSPSTR